MKFKVEGQEFPFIDPEEIRIRELAEAEKALGMSMAEGTAGAWAISLFVSMRRAGDKRPAGLLADAVLDSNLGAVDTEEEDASPPADAGDGENKSGNLASLPTTGPPRSAQSA